LDGVIWEEKKKDFAPKKKPVIIRTTARTVHFEGCEETTLGGKNDLGVKRGGDFGKKEPAERKRTGWCGGGKGEFLKPKNTSLEEKPTRETVVKGEKRRLFI